MWQAMVAQMGEVRKTWQISTQEAYHLLPDPQTPAGPCLQVYKYTHTSGLHRHTLALFPDCGR